jgi:hypothetical protein
VLEQEPVQARQPGQAQALGPVLEPVLGLGSELGSSKRSGQQRYRLPAEH